MQDPYVYPGSEVLINIEDIRDGRELEQFERVMTAVRLREGIPEVPLTVDGYRTIHRHIFQDLYSWAGEFRSVDISRSDDMFCRAQFIGAEMKKRFRLIQTDGPWKRHSIDHFAHRLAEHVSELNAIHPFREGNGRTVRAFIDAVGRESGHPMHIESIEPNVWLQASIDSFRTGDTGRLERLLRSICGPPPEKTAPNPS
jgi:cell filamentation protein